MKVIKKIKFQYILCFGSRSILNRFSQEELEFQYILCFGSSNITKILIFICIIVSIHPMFRFKIFINDTCFVCFRVSIHPMFRFKEKDMEQIQKEHIGVSIHPMFRFKV